MKNNLKKITKFLFATLILVGCSEDLYEGSPETKTNLKIEKVKFKDLQTSSNKILSKTINSLVEYKKTATTNKLVYDEIYNFYIDEENGVSVNLNGKESYTFPIFKSQTDGTVENIVFNENENGDFSIILADYSLTKDELDDLDHSLNEGDVQYYDMSKFGATELVCVDMITTIYGKCDHTHSNGYTCEPEIVTQSYCSWVTSDGAGGGGNPDGAGGSNTGGSGDTGGSGGISGGGVVTSPNPGLTTAQYQLLSQLNTTAGETFYSFDETVTANVLNYIESISSNNQLINSIAYFLNNTNTLWLSNQSAQTQQSIFNYLIANGFSTASKNKINQLINVAIATNSSFFINPTITSANGQLFNNTNDLQDYLSNFSNSSITAFTEQTESNGTKTTRFTFDLGQFLYLNNQINQTLQSTTVNYNLNSVTSNISGATLITQWIQNNDADFNTFGSISNVTYSGALSLNLFVEGIGVCFTDQLSIAVKINKNTGALVIAELSGLDD